MSSITTFKANVANGPITRNDVFTSIAGLLLGGPLGAVLSPVAYRGFQRRLAPWALCGSILALPLGLTTLAMLGLTGYKTEPPPPLSLTNISESTAISSTPNSPNSSTITFIKNEWNKINSGMTRPQVEAVIGKGKLISTHKSMGLTASNVQYGQVGDSIGIITYSDGIVTAMSSNF